MKYQANHKDQNVVNNFFTKRQKRQVAQKMWAQSPKKVPSISGTW